MIFAIAGALFAPIILAFLALGLVWPAGIPSGRPTLLKLSLAVPLGLGLSSVGFFLWLMAFGSNTKGLFALEVAAFLVVLVACLRRSAQYGFAFGAVDPPSVAGQVRLLVIACAAILLLSLASFGAISGNSPHGGWDAVQIWNLRARFLFRGGENWTDAFTPLLPWSQPNYPLLLPGSIARVWKLTGADPTLGPILVAGFFTFATVGVLVSAVSSFRGRGQGALAGIVLLGSGMVVWQGAMQYADVPLGLFVLATLVLTALSDRAETGRYRLLALAGFMAGLAAWTKNEGLLFVLALLVARFLIVARNSGWSRSVKEAGAIVVGLAPVFLVVVGFKFALAPPNYLVALAQPADIISRLMDPGRYWLVIKTFIDVVVVFGSPWIGLPMLLLVYALFVGFRPDRGDQTTIATTFITLGAVLAGYFLVFLITPYDIEWQLETSLFRLVMHLWPGALFGYFLLARRPEEFLKQQSPAVVGQGSEQHVG